MRPIAVILIIFVQTLNVAAQNLSTEKLVELSRSSCTGVIYNNQIIGTGFFISADLVVTAYHVVFDPATQKFRTDLKILTNQKDTVEVQNILGTDSEMDRIYFNATDLAILKIKSRPKNSFGILKLNDQVEDNKILDEVFFSGYPQGMKAMLTQKGTISGIESPRLFIQASFNPGNSGGALLNKNGEVIGIIVRKHYSFDDILQRDIDFLIKAAANSGVIYKDEAGNLINTNLIQARIDEVLQKNVQTGIGSGIIIYPLVSYIKRKQIKLEN